MSKTEVTVQDQPAELAGPASETNLLGVIAAAVADPRIDVEKMERLLAMHEKITTEQRRIDFFSALARIQAKIPHINKAGMIYGKDKQLRSRYAKIEHIDAILRPLLSEEGFAMSFDSASAPNGGYLLSCTLSHQAGHSEVKSLVLPLDKSDFRSAVQSVGSTISYGKRTLKKMHLDIIETEEDDDGTGGGTKISEDQARDFESAVLEYKGDRALFLKHMKADTFADILESDIPKAVAALGRKRRQFGGTDQGVV